jgi:hypothetical protein
MWREEDKPKEPQAMTAAYYNGLTWGHAAAQAYAVGGKQERATIRRLFARTSESYNPFWMGAYEGFGDAAEQRATAIRTGLAPRTIRPGKLESFLGRVG